MSNTPQIRFAGFTDAWEQRELGECMETVTDYVAAGSFADIADHVQYKNSPDYAQLIRTVDLKHEFRNSDYVYVDKKAFDYLWRVNLNEECIVLPNIGANIGEVYYIAPLSLPYEFNVLGPNAILLKTKDSTKFMFTLLQADDFQNKLYVSIASSGQPKFNKTELKSIKILMPQPDEQEKIGAFFSKLDALITLHQRECFSFDFGSRSAKVAQKTISWEQRKLGEISESFEYGLNAAATEYDGKHKYIRITDIDDSTHLFIQDNLTSPDIDFSTADDYLLQAGDVLFARTGASVGKTYIYRSSDGDLYFAGFLIRAKIKRDYDADFVFQNTLTDNYDSYIRITSQRSGQPGVNAQEYANFALSVPCLAEQKKIGAYFTNLDNLITLHQRECFSFDFSGESAKTAQKTISWEQRKFSELTEIRSASRVHKDEWQSSGVPFYRSSDVMAALNGTENEKAFISEELYEKLSAVSGKLEKGDVLVTGGGSVGKPYIVPNNEPLYTKDADLLWIKNNENLDPYFVYTFFFSPTFTDYLNSVSHVGTIAHYTITQLGETPITLPCVSEQQKIGDYFRNLDFLITLHQHKPNKKGHDVLSVMPFKGNQRKPHYLCT